jgi:tetratricopeptide (TPR) repeat protein
MNIIFAILCAVTIGQSDPGQIEFRANGQTVEAVVNGSILWSNSYQLEADDEDVPEGPLIGPVAVGEYVYYAVGLSLYRALPRTGEIEHRYNLPEPAVAVNASTVQGAAGAAYDVEVEIVSTLSQKEKWSRSYRVGGDYADIPFYLSGNLRTLRLLKRDAKLIGFENATTSVIENIAAAKVPEDLGSEERDTLRGVVQKLATIATRDRTNPWYNYFLGRYYNLLGEAELAERAYTEIFSLDRNYDIEMLRMVLVLDEVNIELGNRAFRRAFDFLLAREYEPELMKSLLMLMLYYGHTATDDNEQLKPDRLEILGQRVWQLSPFVEGASYFYQGIADRYEDAGNSVAAQVWRDRAQLAIPHRFFGLSGKYIDFGIYAFDFFLALLIASIVMIVIKFIRLAPALFENVRSGGGLSRKLPFSVWNRSEIAGLLLAACLMTYLLWVNATTLLAIGASANLPHGVLAGNFGHPDAVNYFSDCEKSEQCRFIKALSLQQDASSMRRAVCGGSAAEIAARDSSERNRCAAALATTNFGKQMRQAEEIYTASQLPQAKVNLGLIAQERGKIEQAQKLYRQAQEHHNPPPIAAFNLGQAASSPRIESAVAQGREAPLAALPSDAIYFSAILEKASDDRLWTQLIAPPDLIFDDLPFQISPKAWYLVLIAAVTALLSLFIRPKNPPQPRRTTVGVAGWLLGWIVPGSARQLGLIGPLYLGLFIAALMVAIIQARSGGYAVSIIEAIAVPNFAKFFGAYGPVFGKASGMLVALANYWWVLLLANPLLVFIAELIAPDPDGLVAAARQKKDQK